MITELLDLGLVRGIITAVLLVAFCGMVFWAYSGARRGDFEEAANMPLEDWDEKLDLPLTDWEKEGQ